MTQTLTRKRTAAPRVIVTISMSLDELHAVDDAAYRKRTTRAAFIREFALKGARTTLRKMAGEPLVDAA